uniref:JmjC domain-containing protein n=1 Tax=Lotharella oceanica TaxID=641309 RepID=A0A7S2TYA6_9EUKA|mmetsp:Transcript_32692/g.60798  ORF Transcript_32692/g.60798 Transcript_32692/m.60798 type:complete len:265 (+) Transcript_32692:276-1070(+)
MDFQNRNFEYKMIGFDELVAKAAGKSFPSYYYFRSTPANRTSVPDFWSQWPGLAPHIQMPGAIPRDKVFSSVLRVCSKGCLLFTHYDVMDNLLLQVRGSKHVVLYRPSDYDYLYISTNGKSSVRNPRRYDPQRFPLMELACPFECVLDEGDVLYIPALWFHNVMAQEFSIALNVFWRRLESSAYDQKDTFGNRDFVAAQRAQNGVWRAIKTLTSLPEYYRDFEARRLIQILRDRLLLPENIPASNSASPVAPSLEQGVKNVTSN